MSSAKILMTGIVSIVIQFGLAIAGWGMERVLCASCAASTVVGDGGTCRAADGERW